MTTTLCSSGAIVLAAGAGASSTITGSGAILDSFINESEGVIVSETRKDWVADYSNVDTYNKELLRKACVSHAAKKVVQYDMSGYFSRQEAEIILDVLDDDYKNAVKSLKDLNTVSIRGVND